MSTISVAICGAGLSGLCLAHSLLRAGFDVQVYERDLAPHVRRQGYRITIDEYGIAALQRSLPPQLFKLFLSTTSPIDETSYFRVTNQELGEIFRLTFKGDPSGTDLKTPRQIDRQTLRTIMLEGLQDRVHFGKEAVRVETTSDGATLYFIDGSNVHSSLVVGADGVNSVLRKQFLPDCEPDDINSWGIYGRTLLVQNEDSLVPSSLKTSGVYAMGPSNLGFFFTTMRFSEAPQIAFSRFGVNQIPPITYDYVMWGLVLPKEEFPEPQGKLSSEMLLNFAREITKDFHPVLQRLVKQADVDYTMAVKFRAARKPSTWSVSRTTFMGDAVHVMPPTGSHGGNTALRDAALLAEKLEATVNQSESLEKAIGSYQEEMSKYAFREVEAAKAMMKRFTFKNSLMRWAMLRAIPRIRSITNKPLTTE
ncbi:FAD-dependent oxidoreductase [Lederbergia wuyishanensis]|uniref:2-polyprenyl-6-methoxyphenol hydroxylase-like FAD-dependent oxidoreductase n=1 Tax=Lederbergia wuyishanensis TaxID=1347903 RepID=A0ABU0D2F9_9BACI|nr:NAD(P)/FAD-dependent oxidoreductase [Lederbergia wuyishanensis]MCJ8007255.1 FAD-dependent monooxygenase [Lederbergia wuyishanensis]MDQ0342592.1 2-polyprenyl-6-methoxyphenol hydroxylase-like FAD-dependent oxidoreductase [Lederbergia wuyishanensis]